MAIQDISEVNF